MVAVEPLPLDRLDTLGATDRDIIEQFAVTVPDPIPEFAVAFAAFVAGDNDPGGLDDASPRDLVLANVSARSYDFRVVCLEGFRQVACDPDADVWRLAGEGRGFAVMGVGNKAANRRDVLVLVAGDTNRPQVASRGFRVDEGATEPPVPAGPLDAPFGGCDFATLVTDLGARDTFRTIRTVPATAELYVLVQSCAAAVDVAVVALRDGVAVLETSEPGWNRPVTIAGGAAAWRVPEEWLVSGTQFQAVALRLGDREGWATHAVDVE